MPDCEHCGWTENIQFSERAGMNLCRTCYDRVNDCVECGGTFIQEAEVCSDIMVCPSCDSLFNWDRISSACNSEDLNVEDFNQNREVRNLYKDIKKRKKMIIGKRVVYAPVNRNKL